MRIVLDTNVLVSGLLNGNGKPAEILRLVIRGKVTLLLDERIYAEYVDVVFRPRLRLDPEKVAEVLEALRQGEHVGAPALAGHFPDPDDRPFLEVAVSGRADALVTGNLKDYPAALRQGVCVVDPAGFLRMRSD